MSWRGFVRRSKADIELALETDHDLAEEIDENIARGMKSEEARRRGQVKLGNPQQVPRRTELLFSSMATSFSQKVACRPATIGLLSAISYSHVAGEKS